MSQLAGHRSTLLTDLTRNGTLSFSPSGVASNADGSQETSRRIARGIADRIGGVPILPEKLSGQTAGRNFEQAVTAYLAAAFTTFRHLRPGAWEVVNLGSSRSGEHLARYEPYTHLATLNRAVLRTPELRAVLGNGYMISPDIIVVRSPEDDATVNGGQELVDDQIARRTIIREINNQCQILHAVISCKWTVRSDRAQNSRSEALSLVRNRKGRLPHIAVVTAEPTPSRLASVALGTGDIDMVYHLALPELIEATEESGNDEAVAMLRTMVDGSRLRDIADLPLDLTV